MVIKTFSQRLRGATSTAFPQDQISIFLSDQRLLYVVADHLGQAHFITDYHDADVTSSMDLLKAVFSLDEIFRKAYAHSQMILCSAHAVLCPISSTTDTQNPLVLSKTFLKSDPTKYIQSDQILDLDIQIDYQISNELKKYALQMFPEVSIRHIHTIFIQTIRHVPAHHNGQQIFAFIAKRRLSLLFLEQGEIQLVNQYEVNGREDVLYYTLLIYDQFGLDTSMVPLSITQSGDADEKVVVQLKGYIKTVKQLAFDVSRHQGIIHKNDATFANYFLPLSASQRLSLANSKL